MTDADWLGLLCRTESDRGHEWPWIAWVVRNRASADLHMFGGASYPGVIRKRWQFSAFNATSELTDDDAFGVTLSLYPHDHLAPAIACATWVLSLDDDEAPMPTDAYWFWSPRSMVPEGRIPGWARGMERFCPPGVDPWRFCFARER